MVLGTGKSRDFKNYRKQVQLARVTCSSNRSGYLRRLSANNLSDAPYSHSRSARTVITHSLLCRAADNQSQYRVNFISTPGQSQMCSNFSGLVTRKSSARDALLFRIAHNITGDRSGKRLVEIVETSTMTEEERKPLIKTENDEETESEPGCTGGLCNPKNCIHRYFPVLFAMCLLSFGKYRSVFFFMWEATIH